MIRSGRHVVIPDIMQMRTFAPASAGVTVGQDGQDGQDGFLGTGGQIINFTWRDSMKRFLVVVLVLAAAVMLVGFGYGQYKIVGMRDVGNSEPAFYLCPADNLGCTPQMTTYALPGRGRLPVVGLWCNQLSDGSLYCGCGWRKLAWVVTD